MPSRFVACLTLSEIFDRIGDLPDLSPFVIVLKALSVDYW